MIVLAVVLGVVVVFGIVLGIGLVRAAAAGDRLVASLDELEPHGNVDVLRPRRPE